MASLNNTTTQGKAEESQILGEIRLPTAQHKLYCWKVRQGTAVRKGETIGLATLKQQQTTTGDATASAASEASASTSAPAVATQQYKRPKKRQRKVPPPAAATATSTEKEAPSAATTMTTTSTASSGTLRNLIRLSATPTGTTTTEADEKPAASSEAQEEEETTTTTTASPNDASPVIVDKKPGTAVNINGAKPERIPLLAPTDGIIRFGKPSQQKQQATTSPSSTTTNPNDDDALLIIGVIVACEHPTVVDGLCVVCGKEILTRDNPGFSNASSNNISFHSNDVTNARRNLGITMAISASEDQRMAQQDAERLRKQSRLSLVLDLDHTLLHATNDIRARRHQGRTDVRTLILPFALEADPRNAVWVQHFVKLRPHVREFLEMANEMYEVGVYTAGTRQYAEQVTMLLARHMVNSRMDQTELDHLRHRIAHAEQQFHRQEQQAQKAAAEADQKQEAKEEGATKRRVRFGESTERTDAVTTADLAQLRHELEQAELMEQEAMDYRQRLFGGRVISRTDTTDLGINVKSLKRVFPCGGSMAVVVDDNENVWANAPDNETPGEPPDNMLLVRPYHWQPFAGFADVNNASGDDFGADEMEGRMEKDDDQQLLWTADVLRRIHEAYYEVLEDDPKPGRRTVPEIVRDMRKQVLKDTRIVLSSLVPLHRQQASHLPRPPYVRHAENLGSALMSTVTPETTHVVAAKDGTDKILAARRVPGCYIVKPLWLMDCVWTFTRRDVRPYLWPAGVKAPPRSSLVAGPKKAPPNTAVDSEAGKGAEAVSPSGTATEKETTDSPSSETDGDRKRAAEDAGLDRQNEEKDGDDDDDDDDDDYDEDDLLADLEG